MSDSKVLQFLVVACIHVAVCGQKEFEPRPYDGWYNNLQHPDWGAADTQLIRRSKVAYADSVYQPSGQHRPDPLSISRAVHQGPAGRGSYYGRTAMLVYFGQQIVEEIVDSQRPGCPVEYFNIKVPPTRPEFDPDQKGNVEMTFRRTRYDQRTGYSPNNPRQQLNEITPYLDGQVIYGPAKAWTDAIRSFKGGRLAGTNPGFIEFEFPLDNKARLPFANPPVARDHELRPVSRFHAIGNPRGHENPFLLSFGVLWFRWHNHVADDIATNFPNLKDEQIFEMARKRVIAQYQKIVFYDWLPVWLNASMSPEVFRRQYHYNNTVHGNTHYHRYNPSLHPGIYHEFQAAAMRFGHTLIPPGLWRPQASCEYIPSVSKATGRQYAAIRLCNSFWDSREAVEEDLGSLFRGMAATVAEREDAILVPDLTDSLFGPLEFSRRDLAALNIQRGRDHGLTDYNSVREAYGLPRIQYWKDLNEISKDNNKREVFQLRQLYDNRTGPSSPVDDIDLFTGGMLETTPEGPGELFHTILLEQFLRIRHGDRFWFENTEHSGLTEEELGEIWNRNLADIIDAVTSAKNGQMQKNVFLRPDFDLGCQVQPKQLDPAGKYAGIDMLEPCGPIQYYDYFSGSEAAYALTLFFLFVTVPVTFLIMYLLARRRRRSLYVSRPLPPPLQRTRSSNLNEFRVVEWVDHGQLERVVLICLEQLEKRINVYDTQRVLLRFIDIKVAAEKVRNFDVHMSSDKPENLLCLKLPEYDLVVRFFNLSERDRFKTSLERFLKSAGATVTVRSLVESYILRNAVTRQHRQDKLNKFFKTILNMFNEGDTDVEENIYSSTNDEMTRIELTQAEFGEAFGMKPSSTFVKHMFLLVDENNTGHVSFKQFMNIFILLTSDDADSKIRLLFNMYDINRNGCLTKTELCGMVRSLLDLSENDVTDAKVTEFVDALYRSASLRNGAEMTFADFKRVFASKDYATTLKKATMELNSVEGPDDLDQAANLHVSRTNSKMMQRRVTLVRGYSISGESSDSASLPGRGKYYDTFSRNVSSTSRIPVFADGERQAPVGFMELYTNVISHLETYKLQVFWLTLYILVTCGVFLERSMFYAFERENGGLRRICGHGVTISRGSASVIMFTYACLMLTMCKNMVSWLRETFLHRFVPFDSMHSMHKFIACLSLAFTVVHVIFHAVNLYHISTQPSSDLNCYFREYFRATHELASFQYWAYSTMTGLTGIVTTVLLVVLFVFATPYSRRHLFHAFWNTHKLYFFIYVFILLHGSARLVQEPHFPYYIVGPAVLFAIDKLISCSRIKLELTILKAELLPSDVTAVVVKKPEGFEYKSGQWAQVACTALGKNEFHPFTMTSAPHEKTLTFHIRALGPWTNNFRRVYDPSNRGNQPIPKLILDGPFGEGHQDWYRYEVSVLIGGGIGVTPFASILKDIVHKASMDITIQCKKVYFLWVTRTQKQFEWMTDIIRGLEAVDRNGFVTTHIFVTEFKTKFDLRTSMLYICERHFQKIAGKSLFTGLVATTHFGRPRFYHFLESLRYEHSMAKRLGVFSCGPGPMTLEVERACSVLNRYHTPTYYHHYENF